MVCLLLHPALATLPNQQTHWGQIAVGATSSSVFVWTQIISSPPTSYTAVSSVSLSVFMLMQYTTLPKHQHLHFKYVLA